VGSKGTAGKKRKYNAYVIAQQGSAKKFRFPKLCFFSFHYVIGKGKGKLL